MTDKPNDSEGNRINNAYLAKEINIHPTTIANYLNDTVKNPSDLILEKIADILDVNFSWLKTGIVEKKDLTKTKSSSILSKKFKNISTDEIMSWIYLNKTDFEKNNKYKILIDKEATDRMYELYKEEIEKINKSK